MNIIIFIYYSGAQGGFGGRGSCHRYSGGGIMVFLFLMNKRIKAQKEKGKELR
jgi:hypothetical protein